MSSINLSFKEWPFPSLQELAQPLTSSPLKNQKLDSMSSSKDNLSLSSDSSMLSWFPSDFDILTQSKSSSDTLESKQLKQQNTNYTKERLPIHLSSWGKCGLYACTYDNHLSIYSNDTNGCLSPMFMFSPFIHPDKNKILNSKNSVITAIAWADGCLQPNIARPILAVASIKGKVSFYDFGTKELIVSARMTEPIITIRWSSFKLNRLYLGTNNGHFYICELNNKCLQIKETLNFCLFNSENGEYIMKPVDFIAEDDVDGSYIVVASKDNTVGIVEVISQKKQSKIQIFAQIPFNSCLNLPGSFSNTISFFEFYPNSQDFILIATNQSTFLFSIKSGVLIPFISVRNCKFINLQANTDDTVIVGDGTSISVWKLANNAWIRSSITNFAGKLNQTEILSFSKLNNKILLTTASHWLTELEYRRNKIFVSKRIKLLKGVPIDYDFRNGSIVFLTNNNSISFTSWTPESIVKSEFGYQTNFTSNDKLNKICEVKKKDDNEKVQNLLDSQNKLFHYIDDSNGEEDIPIDSDEFGNSTSYENSKAQIGNSLIRSNSMDFGIGSDSNRAFKQIFAQENVDSFMVSGMESPIPRSKSDLLNNNTEIDAIFKELQRKSNEENDLKAKSLCGNSNSIILTLEINSSSSIEHVSWAPSQKVIAWNKNHLYYIDLTNRTITEPLKDKFDSLSNTITQAFFSKSRKIMCVILNNQTAYLLNTESNLDIISSINLKDKIKKDCQSIYGSLSPKEDQIVFASSNYLFFIKLNDNCLMNFKQLFINLDFKASFVSWKKCGIIIGTELGGVLIISMKDIDDVYKRSEIRRRECTIIYDPRRLDKKNSGSIKFVSPCANNSYIIIDSNGQGIVISGDVQQTITGTIKTLKLCNKDTFLIRFQNINKLIVLDAIEKFMPLPPPCFYLNQSYNISFNAEKANIIESLKDSFSNEQINSIINQIFCSNEEKPSNAFRNSVHLLNQVISYHKPFNSVSLKYSLKLGDSKIARSLLLGTDPNDKEYINKMMLAALFDATINDPSFNIDLPDSSLRLAVNNLMINNRINEAVDLLLITNNSVAAAEILSKFGKYKDAYQVLMLCNHDQINQKNIESAGKLVQDIANSLIDKKENSIFALKLLASFGYISEMINLLSVNLK